MSKMFAHIQNGAVLEIVTVDDNTPSLDTRYHAALLEHFVELHGVDQYTVKAGWNYDGSGFSSAPSPTLVAQKQNIKISVFRERMEAADKWTNLINILKDDLGKLMNLMTLDSGISPDDQEIRSLILQTGADPDEILRD